MNCDRFHDLLTEYALGELADLSPQERTMVEAHLVRCGTCQVRLQSAKRFYTTIGQPNRVETPRDALDALHTNVMANVRRQADYRRKLRKASRFAAAAGIIAACLILGLALSSNRSSQGSGDQEGVVVRESVTRSASELVARQDGPCESVEGRELRPGVVRIAPDPEIEKTFAEIKSPSRALSFLRVQRAVANDGWQIQRIIPLLQRTGARWPGSVESVDALELLSRCYTDLADQNNAKAAYVSYAEAKARVKMQQESEQRAEGKQADGVFDNVSSSIILAEADRLFNLGDSIFAVDYYDLILRRYPHTKQAQWAQLRIGECYSRSGQHQYAAEIFRGLLNEVKDRDLSCRARGGLSTALVMMGGVEEAVNLYADAASSCADGRQRAIWYLAAAGFCEQRPQTLRLRGIQFLNRAIQSSTDDHLVAMAKDRLRKIQASVVNDLGKSLGN